MMRMELVQLTTANMRQINIILFGLLLEQLPLALDYRMFLTICK